MQAGAIFWFTVGGILPNVLLGWYLGRDVIFRSLARAIGYITLYFIIGLVWAAVIAYLAFNPSNDLDFVGGLMLACLLAAVAQIVGCAMHCFDKKDREARLDYTSD